LTKNEIPEILQRCNYLNHHVQQIQIMDAIADVMKNKIPKRNKHKKCMFTEILNAIRFFKIIFKKQIKKYYIYLDQKLNKTKTNHRQKSRR
jgi:hypothetical protein